MLRNYADFIGRYPRSLMLFTLLCATLLSAATTWLTFRSDDRIFFSEANPELLDLERFEAKYGREDSIIFVVTARQGDLFTPQRLAAINTLTERSWHLPQVKRVDSVTNFQRVTAVGDDVVIDHLARAGDPLTKDQALVLKDAVNHEPLLLGRLLTPDARVGLVAVQFRLNDDMAGDKAGELMQAARVLAAELGEKHQDLELRISGSLALDNAFGEASSRDGVFLTPLMFALILALIGAIFRSLLVLFSVLLVIAASIGAAMGSAGLLQIPLSSPSVAAPFIILTLATADCIHLSAAVFRAARATPGSTRAIHVRQGLIETFRPITMTSLTTAIGFFSLTFSESPPFGHLGIIAGSGVVYAWALSVTLLPALLIVLPWRVPAKAVLIPERYWISLHRFIERRASLIAVSVLTTGLLAAALAFTNVLDDRYVAYFDNSFAFRGDTDYLNRKLGGFYKLEYSLDAGTPDGIAQPAYLQQVDALANWLRQQEEVTHVAALSDIMRTVERGMNGGGEESYALPSEATRAAQYLWLYEMSLPLGLDLREQVTSDKGESRMTVALRDLSTQQVLDLIERARSWIELNAPLLEGSSSATGTTVLFSHIGQRNIEQMLTGTFLALSLISLILFFAFRSTTLGGAAIVSNMIPPLAALGGWAVVVGEVGMAVATIAAVTLGIVVDDTIHFIEAAQRARRNGAGTASEAVLKAFLHAGPGIATTTLVLAAGFACLAFSGFQINAWTGLMTAIVIATAFFFDLLFLPSLLIKVRSWK